MYYVYLLMDPRNNLPFYIGKGKGRRVSSHLNWSGRGKISQLYKHNVINEIRNAGHEPYVIFARKNILVEDDAYKLEEQLIASYGKRWNNTGILTNINDGGRYPANAYKGRKIKPRDPNHVRLPVWNKNKSLSILHKNAISKGMSGKIQTIAHRMNVAKSRIANGTTKRSAETKLKIANAITGSSHSHATISKMKETRKNGATVGKKLVKILSPDNTVFLVEGTTFLKNFCKIHSIYTKSLWDSKTNGINKRNPGWIIIEVSRMKTTDLP
jgi:hypothetical protein